MSDTLRDLHVYRKKQWIMYNLGGQPHAYIYTCVYIYTSNTVIYICIHVCLHVTCIYLYMYLIANSVLHVQHTLFNSPFLSTKSLKTYFNSEKKLMNLPAGRGPLTLYCHGNGSTHHTGPTWQDPVGDLTPGEWQWEACKYHKLL